MHLASKFSITATALLPGYTRRFCGKVRKIMVYLVNISEFNKSIFIIDAKHCFFLIRTTFQHPPLFLLTTVLFFVRLFVWGFSSHWKIYHSYGDVTIAAEGLQSLTYARHSLQSLTYARHSWPFSSEGSFACHTFCDTGHPFIIVISEDP